MHQRRMTPRAEFRLQEKLRINASPSLAEKYPQLKSLLVELTYCDATDLHKTGQIKYTVNLTNAKSAFSFVCPNNECVGGDFDLSKKLAGAVAACLATATGEISCQGWRSKATINSVHCHNILRYTFKLKY